MTAKVGPDSLVVCTLSSLLILASIAEIIVASWALYYFNALRNKKSIVLSNNTAYNIDWSPSNWNSSGSTFYDEPNVIFANIWVFPSTSVETTPRAELISGILALIQGLILCVWNVLIPKGKASSQRIVTTATVVIAALLALVVTALFGYVFAARASNGTKLGFTAGPGWDAVGWDAWPSWEQWTCAYAGQISGRPEISAAGPEWREVCSLTTAARWTLVPVFIFAILAVGGLVFVWIRAERTATSGEQVESKGKELDGESTDETRAEDARDVKA